MNVLQEILSVVATAPVERQKMALSVLRGEVPPRAEGSLSPAPLNSLVDVAAVGKRFGLKPRAVYRLKLPVALRVGGKNYFDESAVLARLKARSGKS